MNCAIAETVYYTDSNIVLGYLNNTTRQFTRYVTRRVEAILRHSRPSQWKYVPTKFNPADLATRATDPLVLEESIWLSGPEFLRTDLQPNFDYSTTSNDLPETLPTIAVCVTQQAVKSPLSVYVERQSSWKKVLLVLRVILDLCRGKVDRARQQRGVSLAERPRTNLRYIEIILVKNAQKGAYPELLNANEEFSSEKIKHLPQRHQLSGLSPIIDGNGCLRVGGRLRHSVSPFETKHPLILPEKGPITERLVDYLHEMSAHQGRLITLSYVHQQGYAIIKGRKVVSQVIDQCPTCKALRASLCEQKMSDLPAERVTESAPFTHVGIDVFGPFQIHDGKSTRRTSSTKKLFVLIVTCLSCRGVHLEPLESMDTTAFLNALRRVIAIRGQIKTIRSDHGSNFMGAIAQSPDFNKKVEREFDHKGITWHLNPVGASHFGGVYERKIGAVRRVLEATILRSKSSNLSRDEMFTLLQEAAAIVNITPLYAAFDRAEEPRPLTPAMLLTLKEPQSDEPTVETFTEADVLAYGPRRWRKIQYLSGVFWDLWRRQYLQELNLRRKWTKPRTNLGEGDLVLIRDKNAPRCRWNHGIVHVVKESPDSLVRRVVVTHIDGRGKRRHTEKSPAYLVLLHSSSSRGESVLSGPSAPDNK